MDWDMPPMLSGLVLVFIGLCIIVVSFALALRGEGNPMQLGRWNLARHFGPAISEDDLDEIDPSTIRTAEQICREAARKLQQVKIDEDLKAILGCLLGEKWATPSLVEMVITTEGQTLGRTEDRDYFASYLGAFQDLLRNIHQVAKLAALDGDEVGYLVAKVAEIKRRKVEPE